MVILRAVSGIASILRSAFEKGVCVANEVIAIAHGLLATSWTARWPRCTTVQIQRQTPPKAPKP